MVSFGRSPKDRRPFQLHGCRSYRRHRREKWVIPNSWDTHNQINRKVRWLALKSLSFFNFQSIYLSFSVSVTNANGVVLSFFRFQFARSQVPFGGYSFVLVFHSSSMFFRVGRTLPGTTFPIVCLCLLYECYISFFSLSLSPFLCLPSASNSRSALVVCRVSWFAAAAEARSTRSSWFRPILFIEEKQILLAFAVSCKKKKNTAAVCVCVQWSLGTKK